MATTIAPLPGKNSVDWYAHYQSLDAAARELANSTSVGRALLSAVDAAAARAAIGAVATTDTRLSDSRTPLPHTHSTSEQWLSDALATASGPTGPTTVTAASISDSTTTGRAVLTAASAAAARTALGAGTSSLALGTTASTAKAGDYRPTAVDVSDSTTVGRSVLTAADAAAARTAIGAAAVGAGATTTTAQITDATTVGRSVLTAADAAAARTAIGAGPVDPTFTGTEWRAGTITTMGLISPSALHYAAGRPILAGPPAAGTVPTGWEYWDSTLGRPQKKRSANPDVWIDPAPPGTTVIPLEVGQTPPAVLPPNTLYVEVVPL